MEMFISLLAIVMGSIMLFVGSEWIINAAKTIAKKLNVSDLVIGLTVVAIGTSFPELVVGIMSAKEGHPGFVMGNVLGSNVANIGLALGLPALVYNGIRFQFKHVRNIMLYNVLACLLLYLFASGTFFGELAGEISRKESGALLFVFTIFMIGSFVDKRTEVIPDYVVETSGNILRALMKLVAGGASLYVGSQIFIDYGAVPLVTYLGMTEQVIGMTVVALGTSLPELFLTMVAIAKKEVAISLGNIIGSNIFNIVFVLGIVGLVSPDIITFSSINIELVYGLGLSLLLIPASKFGDGLNRFEGLLFLLAYSSFIVFQFMYG